MKRAADLRVVVEHYKRVLRPRAEAELESFRVEKSLESAVCRAGLAEHPDGTRFGHQRRRTPDELRRGVKNLIRDVSKLDAAVNFATLIQAVQTSVGHLKGLNELYIYDVALHLGAYKGMLPTRVYLHAGTKKGAAALGLEVKGRKAIDMFELPLPLRELAPHEVEDVLCIYKAYFDGTVEELDEDLGCWVDTESQDAEVPEVGVCP